MNCDDCDPNPLATDKPPITYQVKGDQPAMASPLASAPKPAPPPVPPQGAPSLWGLLTETLNEQRKLQLELGALTLLLQRRAIITEKELQEARMVVSQAAQRAFVETARQMGRTFAQHPRPVDPRSGL